MNKTEQSAAAECDATAMITAPSAPVVNHQYLDAVEAKMLREQQQQQLQAQAFFANNTAGLNLIRLARLGLIASGEARPEADSAAATANDFVQGNSVG